MHVGMREANKVSQESDMCCLSLPEVIHGLRGATVFGKL